MEEAAPMSLRSDVIAGLLDDTELEDGLSPQSPIKEEMIVEVMQELYKEIACPPPSSSTYFCTSHRASPVLGSTLPPSGLPLQLTSTLSFLASCSSPQSASCSMASLSSLSSLSAPTLFENGDSQSCPASFSDTGSTLMAGVDFIGAAGKLAGAEVGLPRKVVGKVEKEKGCEGGEERLMMDGCDGGEFGDEWLEKVLTSWAPLELEGWT